MDPSPDEIAALADELSTLAKGLKDQKDPTSKLFQSKAAVIKARALITAVQDPFDAAMDHTTNLFVISSTRALMSMGVFEAIPPKGSVSVSDLAKECKAEEELIIRLMRQLTSVGMIKEPSLRSYAHTPQTLFLSKHAGFTGKYFFEVSNDEMGTCISNLHRYLAVHGNKDIQTYTDTPHSWTNGTPDLNFWQVLGSVPGRMESFGRGLSLFDALHPVLGIFPFEQALAAGNSAERVLAVDIGGGRGGAMLDLRKGCPGLHGRLVVQDMKQQLDSVADADLPGVEKMEHDFFTPQPVKDAQVYYIRRVFHDWQDEEACKILRAVVPAMARDSRILISDMALPEPVGAGDAGAIWLDLMMMTIGGKERTRRDWETLIESAGLKLCKIWQSDMTGPLAVVECMLKDEVEAEKAEQGKALEKPVLNGEAATAEAEAAPRVTNGVEAPKPVEVESTNAEVTAEA